MRAPVDNPPRAAAPRSGPDRCPGVLRPWPADDGALVRVRLVGGRVDGPALLGLLDVAERFGDGRLHLTSRANVQLRGLPLEDGADPRLAGDVVAAVEATGLLPSREHDLVRNVMVSPQSGFGGGRADVRPVAATFDERLRGSTALAGLPGKFLVALDDGRGDLADQPCDLGLVALDASRAQLRVGSGWGDVVTLDDAAAVLADLAAAFLRVRGSGPGAAWHVDELDAPLVPRVAPEPAALVTSPPLPPGPVPGGEHVVVPDGVLDGGTVRDLVARGGAGELVVTPWRGVLVPATTVVPR
ncbi:hypothetical protein GCM10027194_20510 [Thalassiella azotivora]